MCIRDSNKIDTAGSGDWGGTAYQQTPSGQSAATFPTLTIVPGSASTTAVLTNANEGTYSFGSEQVVWANNGASTVNASGLSNSQFSISTSKMELAGLRVTLTNNGNAALAANTGLSVNAPPKAKFLNLKLLFIFDSSVGQDDEYDPSQPVSYTHLTLPTKA